LDKSAVGLGNVENTALSTWAGSTNITTLGTIATGIWHGTAIDDTYISSAATWNSKQAGSTSLTSLAGLTYVSTSFVKMTAAGTFALDTSTYLTANQSITLSGDVGGSGATSITTTIGAGKVTLAMMANLAANSILGNNTGSPATPIALTVAQTKTLLAVAWRQHWELTWDWPEHSCLSMEP
jgi:hypothetical protein